MSGVCLVMIVKNEAHCVATALESARGLVNRWVVVDTGSTDGTQQLVRETMAGLPGDLVERPWVDFAHNRNEALELARAGAAEGDYALTLDADEHLADVPERLELAEDGYELTLDFGTLRYQRPALVRLDRPWRWHGVIHEYLSLPEARLGRLDRPVVVVEHLGARSRDPETYRKDAAVLTAELTKGEDPRLRFYLAQSWYDAGEPEAALEAYRLRAADRSGWEQERWYALYRIGATLERLGRPADEVVSAYLAAYDADPSRIEPLVEAARVERERERHHVALLYAGAALDKPYPAAGALFVDADAYACRRYDEYAVSAYWTGRYASGREMARRALAARPDDLRLRENLRFFTDKVGQ